MGFLFRAVERMDLEEKAEKVAAAGAAAAGTMTGSLEAMNLELAAGAAAGVVQEEKAAAGAAAHLRYTCGKMDPVELLRIVQCFQVVMAWDVPAARAARAVPSVPEAAGAIGRIMVITAETAAGGAQGAQGDWEEMELTASDMQ